MRNILVLIAIILLSGTAILSEDNNSATTTSNNTLKRTVVKRTYKSIFLKNNSIPNEVITNNKPNPQKEVVCKRSYRIIPIDLKRNSKVESVITNNNQIKYYPIPAKDMISFNIQSDGWVTSVLQVYSIQGIKLITKEINIVNGYNKIEIDISTLLPGSYYTTLTYNGIILYGIFNIL